MNTRHLEAFLKIVELGSITHAADALGIAQPTLSQQLLRLEDEVGFKLFRRNVRGVATTDAGRIFQEHAANIIRAVDQALKDVERNREQDSVPVALAMPASLGLVLGGPLAETVLGHSPHIALQLTEALTGDIRTWLEEGSIDLGLLYDVAPMRHLPVKPLAREELYLIGPPGRFGDGEDGGSVAAAELSGLPMILPGRQQSLRGFIESEAARLGFRLTIAAEIDALPHISSLVAAGHGCSILSLPAVAEALAAGRLSAARIEDGAIRRTICLARSPGRIVTAASVRVEDLMVLIAGQLITSGRWRADQDFTLH